MKKDILWQFDDPQKRAFPELKQIITSNQVLKFYNPMLPIKLTTDASQNGAILEQKHDEAEKNYSQIEKEILSIVFGCEKFNEMLYGNKFLVVNDHTDEATPEGTSTNSEIYVKTSAL